MVLDIGPGAGFQLKRFAGAWSKGQIKRIYGVEPGIDMHKQLRLEAASVFGPEVSSRFAVLTTGAQPDELVPALAKEGLLAQQGDGCSTPSSRSVHYVVSLSPRRRLICSIACSNRVDDLYFWSMLAILGMPVRKGVCWRGLSSGCTCVWVGSFGMEGVS